MLEGLHGSTLRANPEKPVLCGKANVQAIDALLKYPLVKWVRD